MFVQLLELLIYLCFSRGMCLGGSEGEHLLTCLGLCGPLGWVCSSYSRLHRRESHHCSNCSVPNIAGSAMAPPGPPPTVVLPVVPIDTTGPWNWIAWTIAAMLKFTRRAAPSGQVQTDLLVGLGFPNRIFSKLARLPRGDGIGMSLVAHLGGMRTLLCISFRKHAI